MSVNSKVDICNLALSHIGNDATVINIDQPSDPKELVFAAWYELTREAVLREMMPNFALDRIRLSKDSTAPAFGYAHRYIIPKTCLRVLGIGNVEDKKNDYFIGKYLETDVDNPDGLPVRIVRDIKDISLFTSEFIMGFSYRLAENVVLPLTQDVGKAQWVQAKAAEGMARLTGINAQENLPVRKSESLFRKARYSHFPTNAEKK